MLQLVGMFIYPFWGVFNTDRQPAALFPMQKVLFNAECIQLLRSPTMSSTPSTSINCLLTIIEQIVAYKPFPKYRLTNELFKNIGETCCHVEHCRLLKHAIGKDLPTPLGNY